MGTILRANAVGDRSLVLSGLMNLFLCKITDELENANDLQFSWHGYSRDSAFDLVDRLQNLYKIGMEKYLNQTITYHSKDSIEEAFTSAFEGIVVKEKIQNIFNELKYFSNGDFNFIEVYNENLFYKNFKILLPIVLKLEDTAFTKNADSNILGDYFESYIHDMPQQEGQYFTPVPLVNFIIHSLPVLKNASVLNFSCEAGHFLTQYAEINKPYKKAKFLGQDKDSRLAKIAKIASFMHQADMKILSNDSFECGIDDSKFNMLISNPPYSIDGFLNVLSDDIRRDYELFSDKLNITSNDAIECFFIEKASKALQSNGLLSLVLPDSLIKNDGIYKATREIMIRDFYIIAIVSLGNQTFFKTNTSPIVLFALRKAKDTDTKTSQNDIYKDFYKHIVENSQPIKVNF
ncbi:HsdM family class I SAM-dependent methyltransferase [Campylobacter upsaliensis]|uniref:HsdM family class I SAM-dependent methyltransferase n=1 Tax=Campylobacter upsaliensis TaxID=28080 RepID=UPI002176A4F5|nr:N-6 DNA methylase [Campylobacter upsaliensis]MEB2808315.1 N-6 DNA methylase [Campylobacter upsaliensis]